MWMYTSTVEATAFGALANLLTLDAMARCTVYRSRNDRTRALFSFAHSYQATIHRETRKSWHIHIHSWYNINYLTSSVLLALLRLLSFSFRRLRGILDVILGA